MNKTRRAFLQDSTLTATSVFCNALRPGVRANTGSDFPTAIDTHTHFYDPARKQGVPWPPPGETVLYRPHYPREFQTLTKPQNVAGTVVIEASPWVEDNQWILDLAKDDPFIVGFIGNLELGKPEFAANLKRFAANPLFRGLRLNGRSLANGLGQKSFDKDMQRLSERRCALDVLGDAAMLPNVVRAAKFAPKLRVIIDHLPFAEWDKDLTEMRRALGDVALLPNVYAKVSNVARRVEAKVIVSPEIYRPALDVLWELFGEDRLVFGSNWPVSNRVAPYASLHKIVADYFSARGQMAAEKFFWKNSLAAYGWIARGETRRLRE